MGFDHGPDPLPLGLVQAFGGEAEPGGGPTGPGVTLEEACKLVTPTFNYSTGSTSPEPYPELRQALLRFSPDGKLPSTQVLSHVIRSLKSYKINGLAFAVFDTVKHAVKWHVTEEKPPVPALRAPNFTPAQAQKGPEFQAF